MEGKYKDLWEEFLGFAHKAEFALKASEFGFIEHDCLLNIKSYCDKIRLEFCELEQETN